jgi:hypothetical protein
VSTGKEPAYIQQARELRGRIAALDGPALEEFQALLRSLPAEDLTALRAALAADAPESQTGP